MSVRRAYDSAAICAASPAACARRKSLSNFAKASLIWVLVVFIISFLAVATLFVLVALGVIVIPEQWNDYTYWANNFGLSA